MVNASKITNHVLLTNCLSFFSFLIQDRPFFHDKFDLWTKISRYSIVRGEYFWKNIVTYIFGNILVYNFYTPTLLLIVNWKKKWNRCTFLSIWIGKDPIPISLAVFRMYRKLIWFSVIGHCVTCLWYPNNGDRC